LIDTAQRKVESSIVKVHDYDQLQKKTSEHITAAASMRFTTSTPQLKHKLVDMTTDHYDYVRDYPDSPSSKVLTTAIVGCSGSAKSESLKASATSVACLETNRVTIAKLKPMAKTAVKEKVFGHKNIKESFLK
jgi:hypothetical protein